MEVKIFVVFAAFCVYQVKSNTKPYTLIITPEDYIEIEKKYEGFANYILLSDTMHPNPLWDIEKPHKNFSRCYTVIRENKHKQAIIEFYDKTLDAGSTLNKNLPEYYKHRVENVRCHINNFGNTMKDYQEKFSDYVRKNQFKKIEGLAKGHKTEIESELKKFFAELKGIYDSTPLNNQKQEATKCEETIKQEMKKVVDECAKIVQEIKTCMRVVK